MLKISVMCYATIQSETSNLLILEYYTYLWQLAQLTASAVYIISDYLLTVSLLVNRLSSHFIFHL